MSCAAFQRILTWLSAAPGGDAKRLFSLLSTRSSLSRSEMETLCCLMQVINESVVLVKLTLHKGQVKAECRDPHDVLEEWDYPDVEAILEKMLQKVRLPIRLYSLFSTPGLNALVARGEMKEHFHTEEHLHNPNPPESCMFTVTHMFDLPTLAHFEAQDSQDSQDLQKANTEPPHKKSAQ